MKKRRQAQAKEAFKVNYKGRVCNKCFESLAEATIDWVKHVQGLYEKEKPANRQ
jgi:hypothetical protein